MGRGSLCAEPGCDQSREVQPFLDTPLRWINDQMLNPFILRDAPNDHIIKCARNVTVKDEAWDGLQLLSSKAYRLFVGPAWSSRTREMPPRKPLRTPNGMKFGQDG